MAIGGAAGIKKVFDLSDTLTSTTARLDMMNDGMQKTSELSKKIFQSAQRSRGEYQATSDAVAKLGTMAGDAFSSNDEVIGFVEQLNKKFTIAGTSSAGKDAAMLQLTQAMGSGVLRGEEFNSILEQAPNIIQTIAEEMGVPKGQLKDMAAQGLVTADIVKNAILGAAGETDAAFESMPKTMEQSWTSFKNQALMSFQPVLERINEMVNSETFQTAIDDVANALAVGADIALNMLNVLGGAISFVSENWASFAPIILGVAAALLVAKAVQAIYNFTLAACPVTWIVIAIITLIAAIYSVCQSIAKFTGIANSGFGVICGGVMVVIGFFKNLGLAVANIALGIWEAMCACGENIWAVFHNVFCDLQYLWYGFLKVVMDVVKGVCDVLNFIPFVNIDTSGLESASRDYANKQAEAQNNKTAYKDVGEAFNKGASTFDAFSDGWVEDAFQSGAAWGDGVVDGINSMLDGFGTDINTGNYENTYSNVGGDVNAIAENTADIKDGLDVTEEEIKYLRDIAEQEAINRFTTAEIHIEQNNHNNISSDMDLDGFVTGLTDAVNEAAEMISEGVHA